MNGTTAIVTGGANGIGRAIVEELVSLGCSVAIADWELETATRVAMALEKDGGRAIPIQLDVSDSSACQAAADTVADRFDGIDYLVNCAGSFIAKGLDATDDDWNRSLGTNVRGCASMVSSVTPWMTQRGGGAIVNVGSVSGRIAQTNRWTYNATKGAIAAMTRCQALDLAPMGIRVNSVSPGWVWTREVQRAADNDRERWEKVWGRYAMLRRLGEPSEIAKPVAFLLSDAASFMTGAEIAIDGGYLAMGPEGLGEGSLFVGSQ